jgi:hypothetical protein
LGVPIDTIPATASAAVTVPRRERFDKEERLRVRGICLKPLSLIASAG